MNRFIVCVVALFVLAVCQPSEAEWMFQGLAVLPGMDFSRAYGVSADGKVVVGVSGREGVEPWQAFRWTAEEGMVGLGSPPIPADFERNIAYAASADGSVIVGKCDTYRGQEAFRWTAADGMVPLGDLGLPTGEFRSEAYAVSADGSVVVGIAETDPDEDVAFRWTPAQGLEQLPVGDRWAGADGVSADGSVVVGYSSGEAFRWTENDGMVSLGQLSEERDSAAHAISADGRVIAGWARNPDGHGEPFRWTEEDGMLGLGFLPGESSNVARALSADGSIIVGGGGDLGGHAFIWDETHGMRNLQDMLVTDGGVRLGDWGLGQVYGISDDGLTIVGAGGHHVGPEQEYRHEAWILVIPEPATSTLMMTGLVLLVLFGWRKRKGISGRFYSIRPSH